MLKLRYWGWIPPSRCTTFVSWIYWRYVGRYDNFVRIVGFEFAR